MKVEVLSITLKSQLCSTTNNNFKDETETIFFSFEIIRYKFYEGMISLVLDTISVPIFKILLSVSIILLPSCAFESTFI